MIGLDARQAIQPVRAASSDVGDSVPRTEPKPALDGNREVWFDDPDAAYLVAASLHRYLDPSEAIRVTLVPTERGPGLQMSAATAELRLVRSLVRRFRGRMAPLAE